MMRFVEPKFISRRSGGEPHRAGFGVAGGYARSYFGCSALGLVLLACSAPEAKQQTAPDQPNAPATDPMGPVGPGSSDGAPEPSGADDLIEEEPADVEPEAPAGDPDPPPAVVPMGAVSGTAWMPGNSPDQVKASRAMPASSALVQLTQEPLAAFPEQAYCNVCVKPEGFFTTTDTKGLFMLDQVPEGNYFLTVEKGQFRRQTEVTIAADQTLAAETAWTTLPSDHAPESGDYMPRIAMVLGRYDAAQYVLGDLGIGAVQDNGEWAPGSAMNRVDQYIGDNAELYQLDVESLVDLVGNLEQLMQYHLVMLPCGPSGIPDWVMEPKNLENLRAYVAAGGGLFVTGWAGTYIDALFPAQLEFLGGDTPPMAYDAATNTWRPDQFGSVANATLTLVQKLRSVDDDLTAWLVGQDALAPDPAGTDGEGYQQITDENIWGGFMDAQIVNINEVTLGLDGDGNLIVDTPRILVDAPTTAGDRAALGVLYRPAGCGRVMYSSYELDGKDREGSTPVERILMYSLMELSVCEDAEPPEVEDPPPPDKPPVPIPVPK